MSILDALVGELIGGIVLGIGMALGAWGVTIGMLYATDRLREMESKRKQVRK